MKKLLMVMWFLLLSAGATFADPPVFDPNDPDFIAQGIPVDGGASVLLIAGASYAIKMLKKDSKKSFRAPR